VKNGSIFENAQKCLEMSGVGGNDLLPKSGDIDAISPKICGILPILMSGNVRFCPVQSPFLAEILPDSGVAEGHTKAQQRRAGKPGDRRSALFGS
jgi:hypothetical protein